MAPAPDQVDTTAASHHYDLMVVPGGSALPAFRATSLVAFLWPMLIAQDPQMRTIQVVLSQFMTSQGIRYPEMFTGALIAVAPALVVFLFLQRWLVQGVARSGLK